jgi:hypothetical protein
VYLSSLDNDALVAGTPKDYFRADSKAQIVPDPFRNCDSAILGNFGHGDLGDVPLDSDNPAKSTLAPMVNRVLTSPYLWWFDEFPVDG